MARTSPVIGGTSPCIRQDQPRHLPGPTPSLARTTPLHWPGPPPSLAWTSPLIWTNPPHWSGPAPLRRSKQAVLRAGRGHTTLVIRDLGICIPSRAARQTGHGQMTRVIRDLSRVSYAGLHSEQFALKCYESSVTKLRRVRRCVQESHAVKLWPHVARVVNCC